MAQITFKKGEDYAIRLGQLGEKSESIIKRAIYEAAKIVADRIKSNLAALPEDRFRLLKKDEKFTGVPAEQKKDLLESFGVSPMKLGKNGFWTVKIGFDGYGKTKTKKYQKGYPNQLIARAVESGSSVRQKTPFVRPGVNATKADAIEAMRRVVDEACEEVMKG